MQVAPTQRVRGVDTMNRAPTAKNALRATRNVAKWVRNTGDCTALASWGTENASNAQATDGVRTRAAQKLTQNKENFLNRRSGSSSRHVGGSKSLNQLVCLLFSCLPCVPHFSPLWHVLSS